MDSFQYDPLEIMGQRYSSAYPQLGFRDTLWKVTLWAVRKRTIDNTFNYMALSLVCTKNP